MSYTLKIINGFFEFFQNVFSKPTETSYFVKNIDNIIIILLTLMLALITVAPTGIIGLFGFLSFVMYFVKLCLEKGAKVSFNSLDKAIFLYLAIAGLSVTYSYLPIAAAKGFAKTLIYFGTYLAIYNVLKTNPKKTLYFMGIIALTASLEAFYAIYQQINGVDALASWQDTTRVNPEQLMNRVYGTLKPYNPNLLAGYLIASFSSAVGMFFYFLTKKNVRISVYTGIGALSIFLAIVLTGSRGAYIAIAGMLAMLLAISGHIIWHDYSNRKDIKNLWLAIVFVGIALVILAVIASPALQHRIASIFAARADSSNSFRMNVWISSIQMFLDNWLIGIGPGNTVFRLTYGFYMKTGFDALGAYCVPLEIAVESGIFALLAFGWLLYMVFEKGAKMVHSKVNIEQKIIISACMIGIIGMMLHGLVDTVFYRPQINLIFWMLIAIFAVGMHSYKK